MMGDSILPVDFVLIFSVALSQGLLVKDSDDEDVQIMSRSSSPYELVFGPLQLSLLIVYLGLARFMQMEAAVVLAAVGIGDGIAPSIGRRYGRHVYRMPFAESKTMEGSVVGVFLGTIAGCYAYLYMLGLEILPLRIILAYAAIAAVVEGSSPAKLDNLLVAAVLHLSMDAVQRWLPA
jgi:dolichol kinase